MNFGRENEAIEFKKTTGELRESMNDICAILNKNMSGTLYFGVKPDGDVVGQEIGEKTLDDVATHIKNAIKPMIFPTIKEEVYDGKTVIEVNFSGTERPYSAYGRYFIRVHDRAEEMSPNELKRMMLNTDFTSLWENNLTRFGIGDVDQVALRGFYQKAVESGRLEPLSDFDAAEVLTILGLMRDGKLTNAGAFLFSNKEPVVLKVATYVTDERKRFTDMNRFRGNIFNLIDIANHYISNHINWRVEITGNGTARDEIPEIPMDAIREIVVNAFAHANYRDVTEHEIDITPTTLEIYNPGEFPEKYKPEDFAKRRVRSMPRNKTILDVLYRSKNVEIKGSGIRKVLEMCGEEKIKYSYKSGDGGFQFSFYRKNSNGEYATDSVSELSKTDNEVLHILREDSGATVEVMANMLNKTTRTIKRSLNVLKTRNYIERVGNNISGFWQVK